MKRILLLALCTSAFAAWPNFTTAPKSTKEELRLVAQNKPTNMVIREYLNKPQVKAGLIAGGAFVIAAAAIGGYFILRKKAPKPLPHIPEIPGN